MVIRVSVNDIQLTVIQFVQNRTTDTVPPACFRQEIPEYRPTVAMRIRCSRHKNADKQESRIGRTTTDLYMRVMPQ